MMDKQFREMDYISAPDLAALEYRVYEATEEWIGEDYRYCVEPVGAPSYIEHIGFVQAIAYYYWTEVEEPKND
jgi:hypothetical protein